MSLINNNNTFANNSFTPSILQTLNTLVQELGSLLPQNQANSLGNINMGPSQDTLTPSNNLFAGSLPSMPNSGSLVSNQLAATAPSSTAPTNDFMPTSPSGGDPAVNGNTGSGAAPTTSDNQSSPTANSDSTPAGSGSTTPTGGDTSSGSGSSYVDNMMKALKANGAPDSLLQAYQHQYQLLGLTGGGNASPSGSSDPTAGGNTPPSGNNDPTAGGSSAPTSDSSPPTGGATPSAGGSDSSSGSSAPSGQGHMIGQIQATNPSKYDKLINDAIQKYGGGQKIDPNIIKGMIWQESKGDPMAAGSLDAQGSKGLLQVTAANAQQYGFGNQYDPAQSIGLGVKMYADALKHNNGDVSLALGEYNQGPGAKTSANAQTYSQKVQEWAKDFAQNPSQLPGGAKEGQLF